MAEYDTDKHILTLLESLQSRILGLDMCLKGLVLIQVMDGGSLSDKIRRAKVLKEILQSIRKNVENEAFIEKVNSKSFFSSIDNLMDDINTLENRLQELITKEEKNEHK